MKKTAIRISALLATLGLALFAMTLSGSTVKTASADTDATVIDVHAVDGQFQPTTLNAPANTPFSIHLVNDDTFDNEHDVRVKDPSGATIAKTPGTCFGPCELTVSVAGLAPGTYSFYCIVHDDMNGTLNVG